MKKTAIVFTLTLLPLAGIGQVVNNIFPTHLEPADTLYKFTFEKTSDRFVPSIPWRRIDLKTIYPTTTLNEKVFSISTSVKHFPVTAAAFNPANPEPPASQPIVLKSPIIHLPDIDTIKDTLVLVIKHLANFEAPANDNQSPALITLHFLDYGQKYDYFITKTGTNFNTLYVILPHEVNDKKWYATSVIVEFGFRKDRRSIQSTPIQSWTIKEVLLVKSMLKSESKQKPDLSNPVTTGLPTPGGSGTSGPSGPRR